MLLPCDLSKLFCICCPTNRLHRRKSFIGARKNTCKSRAVFICIMTSHFFLDEPNYTKWVYDKFFSLPKSGMFWWYLTVSSSWCLTGLVRLHSICDTGLWPCCYWHQWTLVSSQENRNFLMSKDGVMLLWIVKPDLYFRRTDAYWKLKRNRWKNA